MSRLLTYGKNRVVSRLEDPASRQLVDAISNDQLLRESVFRDNWRTLSAKVRFGDDALLLKVPGHGITVAGSAF